MTDLDLDPASFRDPSGFVYKRSGKIYRQVNYVYKENYELLIDSGLYAAVSEDGTLIQHREVDPTKFAQTDLVYKVLEPKIIPFVSYPYEWCFSQLKDAALLTLNLQKKAIEYGMVLKDASAYNVQFLECKPIFIDTLSFEKYVEGEPWVAYRQFCQHFLGPLALMANTDFRLNQLLKIHIDGVSLDFTSKLLPTKTRFNWSILAHIHLHANAQRKHASSSENTHKKYTLSNSRLSALIESLITSVNKLKPLSKGTEWGDYYQNTNYSQEATERKAGIVTECLNILKPASVWDLGANTGRYSSIASAMGISVVAFDIDPDAVEINYSRCRQQKNTANELPLLLDLTNPSSAIGWACAERLSILQRGPVDTIMALALVHHLAISNNVPLSKIAKLFRSLCKSLIIEFVPKSDSQVQRILSTRKDVFEEYNKIGFEATFSKYFNITFIFPVKDTHRTIYVMEGS